MPRGRAIKPHRRTLILLDLVRGLSHSEILKKYQVSNGALERLKADPNFQQQAAEARWQLLENAYLDLLVGSKTAIQHVERLISDEDKELSLKACQTMLNAYCKFTQQSLTLEAFNKLRQQKNIEQNNVLQALSPQQVGKLIASGAALKAMDLSKVPQDVVKLVMREISLDVRAKSNGQELQDCDCIDNPA